MKFMILRLFIYGFCCFCVYKFGIFNDLYKVTEMAGYFYFYYQLIEVLNKKLKDQGELF